MVIQTYIERKINVYMKTRFLNNEIIPLTKYFLSEIIVSIRNRVRVRVRVRVNRLFDRSDCQRQFSQFDNPEVILDTWYGISYT